MILGRVAAGEDPAKDKETAQAAITVADLADMFLQHVNAMLKPGTAEGYKIALLKTLVPKLGKRAAAKVTQAELAQIHLAMRERPYVANRLLAITASCTVSLPAAVSWPKIPIRCRGSNDIEREIANGT